MEATIEDIQKDTFRYLDVPILVRYRVLTVARRPIVISGGGVVRHVLDAEETIDLGAVVTVEYDDKAAMYFLAPHAGGTKATLGKQLITAITPDSPLGAQLIGRRIGDEVRINKSDGEITAIV